MVLLVSGSYATTKVMVICVAWLPLVARMSSRPKLLPRVMSGSVVLLQLLSVLMVMTPFSSSGHENHSVMESEGHIERALPFADLGPGKASSAIVGHYSKSACPSPQGRADPLH